MRTWLTWLSSAFMVLGCARPSSTATEPRAAATTASLPPVEQPVSSVAQRVVSEPPVPPESAPPAAPTPLTLAVVGPMHERTAKPGDGEWVPVVEVSTADSAPVLLRTRLHPDPVRRFAFVDVVAIDLDHVEARLVAGTREPTAEHVPAERRSGLVPASAQARLLAVANGGFQAQHGRYGMRIGEDEFLPSRPDMCTIVFRAGRVEHLGTWPAVAELAAGADATRQTPPCLIERGVLHPALGSDSTSRRWGRSIKQELEVRRTALGLTADRRGLLFGLGDWITPRDLAAAMAHAGAVDAAQLDINWSYTRFLFFGPHEDGGLRVNGTLIPELKYHPREYVSRPAVRDFIYFATR